MKKRNIISVFHALNALKNSSEESNAKFRYGINKNLQALRPEIKLLQKLEQKQNEKLKDFNAERDAYIKEHGKLNELGQSFLPLKEQAEIEKFNTFLDELKEKYKADVEAFEKEAIDYAKMLEETDVETEIKFHKINIENCPDWTTGTKYASALDLLIDEGIIEMK